jgi:hypothetical protein
MFSGVLDMFAMLKLKSCSESQYIVIDWQVSTVISLESPLLEKL